MSLKKKPLARRQSLVVQELKGETLIYDLNENKAFGLNETSAAIWNLCDGSKSISDISRSVSTKFNTKINEEFIWLALDQLKTENLLADSLELGNVFSGMSRREVIKKVGLGSMVALPIISSLVAPTAAMAQSTVAPPVVVCSAICTCTSNPGQGNVCAPAGTCLTPGCTVCRKRNAGNGNTQGDCFAS